MTMKIIAAVLILAVACGGMFFCMEKYSDIISELSELSGNIITSLIFPTVWSLFMNLKILLKNMSLLSHYLFMIPRLRRFVNEWLKL